jgi:Mg/Co/Ni transporter MgtE
MYFIVMLSYLDYFQVGVLNNAASRLSWLGVLLMTKVTGLHSDF